MTEVVACSPTRFAHVIETLKKMAANSPVQHKHGACVLLGSKVFAFGVNKHFYARIGDKTVRLAVHAEVDAMSNLHSKVVRGMDLLVIRIGKCRPLLNSRPCDSCLDTLRQRGIRKAFYSTTDGNIVYEFVDNMPKLHASSGSKMRSPSQVCMCH